MNKKHFKNFYLIVVIFLMFLIPINVKAQGNNKYINKSGVIINKVYNSSSTISSSYEKKNIYNNSIQYCQNLYELQNAIRACLNNKEVEFTINYAGDVSTLESDLVESFDKVCEEDDYLKNNYSRVEWSANGREGNVDINYRMYYLTTKSEDQYVDRKVREILSKIIKESMNDDEKERAIHDYIVKNITYDTTLKRHSAYDALVDGKTVCQGYALLTYKMLKAVGIETRIVTGDGIDLRTGKKEDHAWNLVKIRGNWYQLDCTWDDPVPDMGDISYEYYNKTDDEMSRDHSWDKYKYPAAYTVYKEQISGGDVNIDFTNYRKWRQSNNIPTNKVWTIAFKGGDVDKSSVNNNNVYIFDEASKRKVNIDTNVSRNKIMVASKSEYENGHTYCLVIEKSVLSLKGEEIPSPILMRFTVMSNGSFRYIQ